MKVIEISYGYDGSYAIPCETDEIGTVLGVLGAMIRLDGSAQYNHDSGKIVEPKTDAQPAEIRTYDAQAKRYDLVLRQDVKAALDAKLAEATQEAKTKTEYWLGARKENEDLKAKVAGLEAANGILRAQCPAAQPQAT